MSLTTSPRVRLSTVWRRVIQALLGHASLKTTAGILRASDAAVRSTKSPLEMRGLIDPVRATNDTPKR